MYIQNIWVYNLMQQNTIDNEDASPSHS